MVEQLGDLLGGAFAALVLGGDPDFTGFLDHLFADEMGAARKFAHGSGIGVASGLFGFEFYKKAFKTLSNGSRLVKLFLILSQFLMKLTALKRTLFMQYGKGQKH